MDIISWFHSTTGEDSINATAKRAGLNQPTLSRQVNARTLSPESIVAVARAYDADPIEGLIIVGLITEADVRRHGGEALLHALTDRMLADEVWDRMQRGAATEPIMDGQPNVIFFDGMAAKREDGEGPLDGQGEHHNP